jgi:DNA-binding XRE family transcriptional regulator
MMSLPFQSIGLGGPAMAAPVTNVIEHKVHVVRAKQCVESEECDLDDLVASLELEHNLAPEMTAARQWLADDLPESLAQLRLSKGLSQSQLAKKAGLRQPNISEIEAGKRKPEYATASKIASALDVSIADFYALVAKTS